jgi:large subunit ribosomal protein L21
MYAIIENSGSQRKVTEGDIILVDLLEEGNAKVGSKVNLGKVLLVGKGEGQGTVGAPYVTSASVTGEVVEPVVMGEKLHIQKFRTKKAFKKKTGHRQRYTSVKVGAIKA